MKPKIQLSMMWKRSATAQRAPGTLASKNKWICFDPDAHADPKRMYDNGFGDTPEKAWWAWRNLKVIADRQAAKP